MKQILAFFIFLIATVSTAQTEERTDRKHYEAAYSEIQQMLEVEIPLDLKRAVFLIENAYYDNGLNYEGYEHNINRIVKGLEKFIEINKYEQKIAPNFAAYVYMKIPNQMNEDKPYGMNLSPSAIYDPTATFLTRLLTEKEGSTMSLSLLYKILVNELGGEAYISLSHGFAWIRHQDEQGRWVNLGLDSGTFISDKARITSLPIKQMALLNGTYFVPMTDKETVALILTELVRNYIQEEQPFDDFTEKCLVLALKHYPNSGDVHLMQASALAEQGMEIQNSFLPREDTKKFLAPIDVKFRAIEEEMKRLGISENPTPVETFPESELSETDIPYHIFGLEGKIIALVEEEDIYEPYVIEQRDEAPYETKIKGTDYDIVNRKMYLYGDNETLIGEDTLSPEVTRLLWNTEYDAVARGSLYSQQQDYRFQYQGKENDYEISGSGNAYDFGNRMYDSRLGIWKSIDAKANKFPDSSPYVAMANNPVSFVDLDGMEPTKKGFVGGATFLKMLDVNRIGTERFLLSRMFQYYGGYNNEVSTDGVHESQNRYIYSERWGYIDLKHFFAAANFADNVLISSNFALDYLEGIEEDQAEDDDISAYSYEDLTSNLLGVYFEEYLENFVITDDNRSDYEERGEIYILETFFNEIGVVDKASQAYGFYSLPYDEDANRKTARERNEKSHTYYPVKTSKELNKPIDKKIIIRLNEYINYTETE